MRELITTFTPVGIAIINVDPTNPLWERLLEKWGIAMVMFLLFWSFTKHQQKKDDIAQQKRDLADAADIAERLSLLSEIKDLNSQQLKAQSEHIAAQSVHALRLEQLTKDTTRAITDAEAAHRMLTRKFKRPCILDTPPNE